MSEEHFRLIYDGPAVEDGEMEIGKLAPSLMALGRFLESVDQVVTGDVGRVRVKVRSDVQKGSFDVGIALDILHSVRAWLASPSGTAVANLVTITGISGSAGMIQVVKWLRGRKIARRLILEDGNVRIETGDGDFLVVTPSVARITEDTVVRQNLERFTEPLRDEGIETIGFVSDLGQEWLHRSEEASFRTVSADDPTSQSWFEATYQIKRLWFERGKKWRLSNGAQTILAEIEDDAFWRSVEAAEVSFSSDDFLHCGVRMDQWLSPAGLRTEYVVERVIRHIPAARQPRLL